MRRVWLIVLLSGLGLVALIATLGFEVARASDDEGEADRLRVHTYEVLIKAERFGNLARDTLRSQRAYLLTTDSSYLQAYETDLQASQTLLAELRVETADNPRQQASLSELATEFDALRDDLEHTLNTVSPGEQEAVMDLARAGTGREAIRRIAAVLDRVVAEENQLLEVRTAADAEADARVDRFMLLLVMSGVILLAGSAVLGIVAARQNARRQELDRLLHTVLASIDGAAFAKDAKGRYTLMSEVGARLFGRPVHEILGRTDGELRSPLFATQAAYHEARVLDADGPMTFREAVQVGGREMMLATTRTPLRDGEGRVVGVAGVALDVTARREAEAALARAQAETAAVFEQAALGIAQADPVTGRLMRVNAKMAEITGYPAEVLTGGMTIDDLVPPGEDDVGEDGLERLMTEGTPLRREARYRRRDGSTVRVHASMTMARTPDGQPLRAVALMEELAEPVRAGRTA